MTKKIIEPLDPKGKYTPQELENRVVDAYSIEGEVMATAIRLNVDPKLVRGVLESPKLAEKLLARRRGALTLDFFDKVIPALIKKASDPKATGSQAAATTILKLTGLDAKGPVGRPKHEEEEKALTLEQLIEEVGSETDSS